MEQKEVGLDSNNESEEFWIGIAAKYFLNISGAIIVALDKTGKVRMVNDKGCEVLGWKKEEILGKDWFSNFLPERNRKDTINVFAAIINENKEIYEYFENPVLTKEGEEKVISWHNSFIKDDGGKVIGSLGFGEDITKKEKDREEIAHNYDIQQAINSILELSLEDITLDEILSRTLSLVLSVSWLSILSKGSIFLVDKKNPGTLILSAQIGLAPPLLLACAKVPFGKCLCGKAAATKQVVFENSVTQNHVTKYAGIKPHGHFCVPILRGEEVIGVLNTYIKEGYEYKKKDEEFLKAIANAIAGVVKRKEAEQELLESKKKLEAKIKELEKFHKLTINREIRMIELKETIAELEKKAKTSGGAIHESSD